MRNRKDRKLKLKKAEPVVESEKPSVEAVIMGCHAELKAALDKWGCDLVPVTTIVGTHVTSEIKVMRRPEPTEAPKA